MQTISLVQKNNYAILTLQRGKVNAINQLMVEEVRATVQQVQKEEAIQGLILTGIPHFFSAGLDVIELYEYDPAAIRKFMLDFGKMHEELVRFPKPLISAITGHAPAGGTVIAIATDYRIMAEGDKYVIGLNEMAVNIPLSKALIDSYTFWLGSATANEYILDGKLMNPKEALACGLVNEVVPAKELMPRAEQKMKQYLQADPIIFQSIKANIRKDWMDNLGQNGDAELQQTLEIWWNPAVRQRMKFFVDRLAKKS